MLVFSVSSFRKGGWEGGRLAGMFFLLCSKYKLKITYSSLKTHYSFKHKSRDPVHPKNIQIQVKNSTIPLNTS